MALVRARELFDEAPWYWGCAGAGAVFVTGLVTWRAVSGSLRHKAIEKRRKNYREEKLQEKRAYALRFNASEDDVDRICSLSLPALQEQLQSGVLSASQVLQAYQAKVADEDEKINCVTDYITEAEAQAKELDAKQTKGPLYGLPISVKELHAYKGYPSTLGLHKLVNFPAEETFCITEVLQKQGAVPFVRSNTPYICLSYTCWNPLYGKTSNPLDTSRQPGGSSSGEAALVAAGATAVSIGSDIGGSIRQPATWCGIVGLKCGTTRLSSHLEMKGVPLEGWEPVLGCSFGPMTRDVDSAAFIMRHLLVDDMFMPDPYTPPIPFREEIYNDRKPLRIGYYNNDNITVTVPSFTRAVDLVKVKLEEQGHTLLPFDIPTEDNQGNRWVDMYFKIYAADGGKLLDVLLSDDRPGDLSQLPKMPSPSMPRWLNRLLCKIYKMFDKRNGEMKQFGCGTGSVFAWWEMVDAILTWRRMVTQKMTEQNIDTLLSPAFSCPAMLQKHFYPLADYSSYVLVYNLLDWPAGVLPVTNVTSQDIQQMERYPTENNISRNIKEGMQGSEGLPVSVQIAAPPYGEELCLRLMKEIEEIMQYKKGK